VGHERGKVIARVRFCEGKDVGAVRWGELTVGTPPVLPGWHLMYAVSPLVTRVHVLLLEAT
jgi:hypothetical protein